MATLFYTGCSLDGFIATRDHDLTWLTTRSIESERDMGYGTFVPRIGAAVMGASTWQWMLDAGESAFMGGVPTVVLTHREFEPVEGMRFTAADDDDDALRRIHAGLVVAAGDKDVWVVGGGALAARLAGLGLVDEFWVQFAPVTLGEGQPLCPGHVELRLLDVVRNGDFVCTRYAVEESRP
ncbi:dihydrofolate reductase family protein [Nocardioides yefusunii]|uniref:Dihydrofolate reductase family protein n=1 Tax=Nocardioides yefusunii TaxID=2500546 RepID=A0ABW1R0T3_9ACTN|nr:dihydrofolate reductase family protein [Nocardioides yefusunii]